LGRRGWADRRGLGRRSRVHTGCDGSPSERWPSTKFSNCSSARRTLRPMWIGVSCPEVVDRAAADCQDKSGLGNRDQQRASHHRLVGGADSSALDVGPDPFRRLELVWSACHRWFRGTQRSDRATSPVRCRPAPPAAACNPGDGGPIPIRRSAASSLPYRRGARAHRSLAGCLTNSPIRRRAGCVAAVGIVRCRLTMIGIRRCRCLRIVAGISGGAAGQVTTHTEATPSTW
jgi:hypothetical protein